MSSIVLPTNLQLKAGVKLNERHRRPAVFAILLAVAGTPPETTDGLVWVTSANDSKHKRGSKHYTDEAFDIRTRNIKGFTNYLAQAWADRIKVRLGKNYDVIFEGDHIHVEYDPK